MTPGFWRFVNASVTGSSHIRLGIPCQDAMACQLLQDADGEDVLLAVVADGAGSASMAKEGATLACSLLIDEVTSLLAQGASVDGVTESFVQTWLERFQDVVEQRAEENHVRSRDFACTFLSAIVGVEKAVFAQVGDGAIVVSPRSDPDEYSWVFWPQKGEYENQTTFATDQAAFVDLAYAFANHAIDEVALFSDGLQRLVLDFQAQTAYQRFFLPMFKATRDIQSGSCASATSSLATYLESSQINERTDDDRTLILATRRDVPPVTVDSEDNHDPEQPTGS